MEEVSLPLVEVRTRLLEVCLGVREHGIVTGLCTTLCDVCTTCNLISLHTLIHVQTQSRVVNDYIASTFMYIIEVELISPFTVQIKPSKTAQGSIIYSNKSKTSLRHRPVCLIIPGVNFTPLKSLEVQFMEIIEMG